MNRWCFRCGTAIESSGNRCPHCRSLLGDVLQGGAQHEPPKPVRLGFISEDELSASLSREYGHPEIDLDEFDIAPEVIGLIDAELAIAKRVVPVNRAGASLIVAMADPSDVPALNALRHRTGLNIEVVVSGGQRMQRALVRYYGLEAGETP